MLGLITSSLVMSRIAGPDVRPPLPRCSLRVLTQRPLTARLGHDG